MFCKYLPFYKGDNMFFSIGYTRYETDHIPLRLLILGIDYLQDPVSRPYGMPIWQCFQVSEGTAILNISDKQYRIKKGDGFIIPSHIPHEYHAQGDLLRLNFVGFGGNCLATLAQDLGISSPGAYHYAKPSFFLQQVMELEKLLDADASGTHHAELNKKRTASKLLYAFLIDLSENLSLLQASAPDGSHPISRQISVYLEDHYNEDISLEQLSDSLGYSKEYICGIFRRDMKKTIITHLTEIRIAHARTELITNSNKKIAEIASDCGFASPSYFGKKFKEYNHMTPDQYRLRQIIR